MSYVHICTYVTWICLTVAVFLARKLEYANRELNGIFLSYWHSYLAHTYHTGWMKWNIERSFDFLNSLVYGKAYYDGSVCFMQMYLNKFSLINADYLLNLCFLSWKEVKAFAHYFLITKKKLFVLINHFYLFPLTLVFSSSRPKKERFEMPEKGKLYDLAGGVRGKGRMYSNIPFLPSFLAFHCLSPACFLFTNRFMNMDVAWCIYKCMYLL